MWWFIDTLLFMKLEQGISKLSQAEYSMIIKHFQAALIFPILLRSCLLVHLGIVYATCPHCKVEGK